MIVTAAMCALATASLAAAAGEARRCHPDLPGTRSFTVQGHVTGYSMVGGRVAVDWVDRTKSCAGTAAWDYASAAQATASASCERSAGPRAHGVQEKLVAAQGNRVVRIVLAPASVDRPDRLDVFERTTHRKLASWPLIARPARVALYGDLAVLSAASRQALYVLRISDGRIAMIGISRSRDEPLIGAQGVLYQDDLDMAMHHASPNSATLKLVPLATVRREIARAGQQVGTSRITAIAMDGKRVAFVVHDPQGKCDKVLFWSIPWHYVSRLTQHVGPTCLPTHAAGGITSVAIAGERAVWTTRYGGLTRVLAASIIDCVEWVVARPIAGVQRVAGLSGDGNMLAYATARSASSSVGVVPETWGGHEVARSNRQAVAISADSDRLATLYADGTVTVVTRGGRLARSFSVGEARAIALRRNTVAVLRAGTLDVYQAASGQRLHSWTVPAHATSVDLHYGIAVLTAGRDVFAVNTTTGRTARLLHAPGRVAAQIEAPGAAVQFNVGDRGYLRFVPMSVIEARTS
jgi:hypothetical protein